METLYIFGWNANYVQRFRKMLQREPVFRELTVMSQNLFPKEKTLLVAATTQKTLTCRQRRS